MGVTRLRVRITHRLVGNVRQNSALLFLFTMTFAGVCESFAEQPFGILRCRLAIAIETMTVYSTLDCASRSHGLYLLCTIRPMSAWPLARTVARDSKNWRRGNCDIYSYRHGHACLLVDHILAQTGRPGCGLAHPRWPVRQ